MKIAVVATGGIGGYYGGLLAKAGHAVTFVARGAHGDAMRAHGLHVKSIDDEFVIHPARVTDDPATIGPVDLVLFCVKTYDTQAAARALQPLVREHTTVVTFQNGVESAEQIGAVVGRARVLPAPTQIETFISAPGEIQQVSQFRKITFGEMNGEISPRVQMLAELFRPHGLEVLVTTEMPKALWNKFLILASAAGLATLARTPPYDLFQSSEAREILAMAMQEIAVVARAAGVQLDDDAVARGVQFVLGWKAGQKPSMLKDIERGSRLEIDALSGAVVRIGKKHGIPTPVHQTIYVGLKPVDERKHMAQ